MGIVCTCTWMSRVRACVQCARVPEGTHMRVSRSKVVSNANAKLCANYLPAGAPRVKTSDLCWSKGERRGGDCWKWRGRGQGWEGRDMARVKVTKVAMRERGCQGKRIRQTPSVSRLRRGRGCQVSRLEGMHVRVSGVEYESKKGISKVAIDNDYLPKIYMPTRESQKEQRQERGRRWRREAGRGETARG
jgi:hypothetical protein